MERVWERKDKRFNIYSRLFEEIFDDLHILKTPFKFGELVKLTYDEGLTIYDASYLYASRRYMYKLVTEDRDLQRHSESIGVKEL